MNTRPRFRSRVAHLAACLLTLLGISSGGEAFADPGAAGAEGTGNPGVADLSLRLEELKAEVDRLKAESAAASSRAEAASGPVEGASEASQEKLHFFGYGEIYYTYPTLRPRDAQADLARAVLGMGYAFSDRTTFGCEYELEHAVASASDAGEFEVEQFYVDHEFAPWAILRGGLFLMPFGLLNEHHEPTIFYGVQRNFVETVIIPSTWREGGLEFNGRTEGGLAYGVGVTTGFDLSRWDFAPEFPPYHTALELEDSDTAPLQASHQELALANASHPAFHLSLNYQGVPGLLLGGAVFHGSAVKVPSPPSAPGGGTPAVSLFEAHARFTAFGFDLSALYARGGISDTASANAANPGSPNPIPAAFDGFLVQAAYAKGWGSERYRVAPFVRLEHYDMGSRYEGTPGPVVPAGSVPFSPAPGDDGPWPERRDWVSTFGVNLYLDKGVVFKVDYQSFNANTDFRRIDLGLGLSFD